ncbi:hypothetical protein TTHERM_001119392 (macronuclear) [Tetrahymena thermophila SB210]|uniref:Uncharacterized protein n=1 Tax=Tetrahymena thermophila (strain SB210) TaxID=312017 RepID=W7X6M0_TETTS|nr:hypothetical protein TTHERM_001119392 [Tetrahymena thermophila SB210]EWS75025.1 hypothetical protein TTHERM_001119392 [Tetrahymena thermophila SB210]|eukprot:XP_012652438.1 hypothetical protein TTHERM_001119392 [Tetrahymena thermophila SB210]
MFLQRCKIYRYQNHFVSSIQREENQLNYKRNYSKRPIKRNWLKIKKKSQLIFQYTNNFSIFRFLLIKDKIAINIKSIFLNWQYILQTNYLKQPFSYAKIYQHRFLQYKIYC